MIVEIPKELEAITNANTTKANAPADVSDVLSRGFVEFILAATGHLLKARKFSVSSS